MLYFGIVAFLNRISSDVSPEIIIFNRQIHISGRGFFKSSDLNWHSYNFIGFVTSSKTFPYFVDAFCSSVD